MKVVIYNDTTNAFGRVHFGCRLVMESMRDLLTDNGFDVIGTIPLDDARTNTADESLLARADLVIANGEGSYHHDRRPDFARIAKKYPTALINTVYEDNGDDLRCFEYIAARESRSRDAIAEQVPCDLVPDVIFTSKYLAGVIPAEVYGIVNVQHYPMLSQHGGYQRSVATLQKETAVVPFIARSAGVITGSFHAGCVAAYYGKPMHLMGSNTHKMQGLAADMGIDYLSDDLQLAERNYVKDAQQRIQRMVDHLRTLGHTDHDADTRNRACG